MLNQTLSWLNLSKKGILNILLGAMIMAFTIVNVHEPAQITEGGILGLSLFSYKVLGLNPSLVSLILDLFCVAFGISVFGKSFLKKTAVASLVFAFFYKAFISLGLLLPNLHTYPLVASIVGGIGIGIGCGLVISQGGAAGGDDALAFIISKKAGISITRAYFMADLCVLSLSLIYIPFGRIFFSLLTTTVSSFLVGQFEIQLKTPLDSKASVQLN